MTRHNLPAGRWPASCSNCRARLRGLGPSPGTVLPSLVCRVNLSGEETVHTTGLDFTSLDSCKGSADTGSPRLPSAHPPALPLGRWAARSRHFNSLWSAI